MVNVLPVQNVINVTISATPSGLSTPNVNSLLLLTNEQPSNVNPYGIYLSAQQVAADYGTASVTAAMANAVFSQVPNVLSGDGQLVIAPLLAGVSATVGQFTTANITANLANLIATTNGSLRLTVDGVVYNLSGLNFSGATSLGDIATVLKTKLPAVYVYATATGLVFKSKKVGTASTIALGATGGGGTDISAVGYLNGPGGVAAAGVNTSGETIAAAVTRLLSQVGFVGVMTSINLEDAAVLAAANAVQAQDLMFLHHFSSPADLLGIVTTIKNSTLRQTRPLLYTGGQPEANLMKAAYAGRGFSTDFSGSNTAETMNLKALATISPDPYLTQTDYVNANIAGADVYVDYPGVPAVFSTGGNDFFDNPYGDIALKFALETAGFDYLRQTNTKVPQTEPGMNGLKAAYARVMQQFVANGCLAPGEWNSSSTFGDPLLFTQNIRQNGFYIYSTPVALQSVADRDARKAPLVQIAAKRAGAIHTSNVLVIINN